MAKKSGDKRTSTWSVACTTWWPRELVYDTFEDHVTANMKAVFTKGSSQFLKR